MIAKGDKGGATIKISYAKKTEMLFFLYWEIIKEQ